MSDHIAIDFETFFSTKLKYGVKQMIAEEYCRNDLFECYLVSVCNGPTVWAGHPSELLWENINGKVWVSHNRYFDNSVFNELQRRGLIPAHIKPAAWHCTANLTSYLCLRRSLAESIEYLYKQKVSKDYRDTMDGKHFSELSPEDKEKVIVAGRVDARWCWRLWKDFSPQWPEMEQRLSNMTIDQGMRGVQIDTRLLTDYILWAHDLKLATEKVIPWMIDDESEEWDDFNRKPSSTKCIAEQCRRAGIPCPPTKSADEEGYEEWETQYGPRHPWIKAVSAWRSVNKLYCTFLTVKRRLRSDGTMPFALKYFGAHTGRWAGDAKINFQNMRKKPLFINQNGLMEDYEPRILEAMNHKEEHGVYPEWVQHALDFRALIIPRPGTKMVACDLSQIEPRVLAHLGKNKALLKLVAEGYSVYEAFAISSMGYSGPRFTGAVKKSDYYKMIKIQVLGLGYGAGWEKFISICWNEGGIDITRDDPEFIEIQDPFKPGNIRRIPGYGKKSREVVDNFREKSRYITGLWGLLEDEFRKHIGKDFTVTLPSGRTLVYKNVKRSETIEPDPITKKPRRKSEFTAEVGNKRVKLYGGKLTENVVQAVARDVFAYLLIVMLDLGWPILFTVHDEAVLELGDSVTASDVEHVMSECPPWLKGCPVACEGKEILHYEK